MHTCVILTGAGISAESGLQTFRGQGGLWEGSRVEEVATPQAWAQDPARVLRFYNQRRDQVRAARPNAAHRALAEFQQIAEVRIITQNVDDLHERAGSTQVLHLHGEIRRARSTSNPAFTVDLGEKDIALGDLCPHGSQLRPDIVWFGEAVPAIHEAVHWCALADVFIVVGTSLAVYPAASLIDCFPPEIPAFCINPDAAPSNLGSEFTYIQATAVEGLPRLLNHLAQNFQERPHEHFDCF